MMDFSSDGLCHSPLVEFLRGPEEEKRAGKAPWLGGQSLRWESPQLYFLFRKIQFSGCVCLLRYRVLLGTPFLKWVAVITGAEIFKFIFYNVLCFSKHSLKQIVVIDLVIF